MDLDAANMIDGNDLVPEERSDRRRPWMGWLISGSFHGALIALMSTIYYLVTPPEIDVPPIRIATIEAPPVKEEKPKELRTLDSSVELQVVSESEIPSPISTLDMPVEISEREEDNESPVAKGREEAVADSEMGGSGAFMAIGAGGGNSGMFGSRSGGGRKRALGKFGGSKGSESAVDAALRWFKKHQSPDGSWVAKDYIMNCTENPKCEPGNEHADSETTPALTGYAVLCFLGAGFDHQTPSKFKPTVKKGLDHLVANQKADGSLGRRNYEHAVATMALAEAYAMTGDPALKTPAQNGVNVILARQNHAAAPAAGGADSTSGTGLGWDYIGPDNRNDSSVTGWNVMALKSAMAANLNVGTGMEGAKRWLISAWKATNPDWQKLTDPYKDQSRFAYTWMSDTQAIDCAPAPAAGEPTVQQHDLACVGAVCAVFLGHHAGDPLLETLSNYIMDHQLPVRYPCNVYYLYYNTLAMFQVGGDRWKKWNVTVRDLLVNAQRKGDGCFDGSWDVDHVDFHGADTGRVLITAYACLSLEVYYRYAQVAAKK